MKNKQGNITIEALICVSTLVIVLLVLFQLIMLHSIEDVKTQQVYEALGQVELANYTYEKIGFLDSVPKVDHPLVDDVYLMANKINHLSKQAYLKQVFQESLEGFRIETFAYENEWVSGQVSYQRPFVLGNEKKLHIHYKKRLWLFGNQSEKFPNKTLGSYINEKTEEQVFITKTGSKYHMEGCFYLRRSTTDKDGIQQISVSEARKRNYLPCKRCYGKRSIE